jgi:hypothetical protein
MCMSQAIPVEMNRRKKRDMVNSAFSNGLLDPQMHERSRVLGCAFFLAQGGHVKIENADPFVHLHSQDTGGSPRYSIFQLAHRCRTTKMSRSSSF